ncbi:hypothetical protein BGZ80_011467 [Entomortierella chlamydospora]|uniref:Major facilitator superfamily (MFS) profile domain-containing protein n=1 Tax=Entomortierella chlamydospora TaxID=101097 RepID=A0A9P6MTU2_9FUNG|nr:hypothetical protein BGZ79_001044 [Entomortierella chlamydospora]KAG0012862.1 hypothetical protein BGZ80_011467 [Entomortierella chlamydospora]
MSSAMSYVKGLFVTEPKTDDPKNWTNKQKYIVVTVIAYCAFVSPLASSIYMPAIVQVRDDLNTTSSMVSATLSVYVLILGIMPVFWASLCDYLGRRPIYIASMTIFIIGSFLAAISKNIWVFFFMRAIQAFGSSSVLSVGGGSLSDIFHSGERGSAFGLYYLGPLIAPMIGPILGGVLSDRAGWRSTMWLLFGAAVVALFLVIFILPETYRRHIDESPAPEKETAVDASHVSRSHIYSTHSTLVASKTSLHSTSSRRSAVGVPLSIPSDRMSIHSAHSAHTHHSVVNQTESAMEFIVPNFVPPYMMQDDEDEANNAEGSGNSSIMKAGIQKTETRHVAFPTEKQELEQNEKQADAKSAVSVAIAQEAMTDGNNEGQDEIDESLKRKPFNPLRPLLCLRKPTNALLVTFNALALGSQFCMNNTLPISFTNNYNLSESIIGVCFCAGGFGSVTGSLIGGRYSDFVMRRWLIKQELKRQRDEKDRQAAFGENSTAASEINIDLSMRAPPEVRLQSVWLGVFVLPIGLMLFGWSVQKDLPLPVPLVAIFLVGFGMMMVFSSTTTALVDANSDNNMATAAVACNSFARGVTGAIGGFTALPLEAVMGSGWLYTFWAFMTLIGAGGLVLMVVKAKSWRERAAAKALDKV